MRCPILVVGMLLLLLPLVGCSDHQVAAPDPPVRIEGALTAISSAIETDGPVVITVEDLLGRPHELTMNPWTMTADQWKILQTLQELPLGTWIKVAGRPVSGSAVLELVELEVPAPPVGGCSGNTNDMEIPDPVIEPNHPIMDTPTIYCVAWDSFDPEGSPAPGTRLLTSMINAGFCPTNAWFPTSQTPCEAMGAVTVVYVQLQNVDDRLLDHGFLAEPTGWWIINCAVPTLWHYTLP